MKKSLIALAVLGAFSGAAFAQSNVTLYGILDVNVQSINPDGSTSSTTGINGGYQSGNRFGLRGSEALGGGLSAIFTIEGGFDIDTGASGQAIPQLNRNVCVDALGNVSQGTVPTYYDPSRCPAGTASAGFTTVQTAQQTRIFGRQAWAGLSGGFGQLVAGRIAAFSSGTGSFDMIGATDPFGASFADLAQASTMSSANSLRLDNTVAYMTPQLGGFKAGVAYSFNAIGGETPDSGTNAPVLGLGANFASGPFYFAVTYDIISPPDTALPAGSPLIGANDQKNLQLGGSWDLKFVKLFASYAKEEDVRFVTTGGSAGGVDADTWNVGVNVPVFGGTLMAGYADRDADPLPGAAGEGADLATYGVAYTYPFSRRTNLYAVWAVRDGDGSNNGNATWDRKVYTLGIRHLF
jgi:predicted porin